MKNRKHLFLFSLFICFSGTLTAEENAEEEALVDLSFSVFPLEPANWEGIHYSPSGEPASELVELFFNPHERSLLHDYKGPSPLRFFRTSTNEEGEIIYQTVAAVVLTPGKRKNPLIFFFEPEEKSGPYSISVMENSPKTFPDESLVFFNTMNIPFQGVLGTERFTLAPGVSEPIPVKKFFREPAPIALAIEHDNDIHLVLRNKIRFSPERKTLLILRKPRNPKSLRIRTQRLTEYTGDRGSDEDPGT